MITSLVLIGLLLLLSCKPSSQQAIRSWINEIDTGNFIEVAHMGGHINGYRILFYKIDPLAPLAGIARQIGDRIVTSSSDYNPEDPNFIYYKTVSYQNADGFALVTNNYDLRDFVSFGTVIGSQSPVSNLFAFDVGIRETSSTPATFSIQLCPDIRQTWALSKSTAGTVNTKCITSAPSRSPSKEPSNHPTDAPSGSPTEAPTNSPSVSPSSAPSTSPSRVPSAAPSELPSSKPSVSPSISPTESPSERPSASPVALPSSSPSDAPLSSPSRAPSERPSASPVALPSSSPTESPSESPSRAPSERPSASPVALPSSSPTESPSESPSAIPSRSPTATPTRSPSEAPSSDPTELLRSIDAPSKNPTETPSKDPSSAPSESPIRDCTITFNLYNSKSDALVAPLTNGTTIPKPPPCGKTNIQAVVPCGASNNRVIMELWRGARRVLRRTETWNPYFLFGNSGTNLKDGSIAAGRYGIRAIVDGTTSPFTNFTLGGKCSKDEEEEEEEDD